MHDRAVLLLWVDKNGGKQWRKPYTVYLMKGNGQGTIVTSYQLNSTNLKTIRFYNLDAGTKYAFVISKANDGSILSGTIKVKTSN